MITFNQYLNGKSAIKFSPNLVLGWLVEAGDTEVHYALFFGGRVLRSDIINRFGANQDSFDFKGLKWTEVNEVPDEAEFIGNYKAPKQ